MPLEPHSRICEILDTLADPEDYIRGILGSFIEHKFDKATSVVRIGVSGEGIFPNYSIETPYDPTYIGPRGGSVQSRCFFSGRDHQWMSISEAWSSGSMTFSEVQALLGRLRLKA